MSAKQWLLAGISSWWSRITMVVQPKVNYRILKIHHSNETLYYPQHDSVLSKTWHYFFILNNQKHERPYVICYSTEEEAKRFITDIVKPIVSKSRDTVNDAYTVLDCLEGKKRLDKNINFEIINLYY